MQFGGSGGKRQEQWILHHDNPPSQTSLAVQQFLAEKNIPVITQAPHSPDLAPSDYWLFFTLNMGRKGTHFANVEDIKLNAMAELRKIPKEAFRRCSQKWQDRQSKCVVSQGPCSEGDYITVAYVLSLQCNTNIPGTFLLHMMCLLLGQNSVNGK
jgi:hypothetical protein